MEENAVLKGFAAADFEILCEGPSDTAVRNKYGRQLESMPSRFLYEMKGEPPPKGWRAIEQKDRDGSQPQGSSKRGARSVAKERRSKKRSKSKARSSSGRTKS